MPHTRGREFIWRYFSSWLSKLPTRGQELPRRYFSPEVKESFRVFDCLGTTVPQISDARKNNRAADIKALFFHVVCQTMKRNFLIWGSDINASRQQKIFHSLPLLPTKNTTHANQVKGHFAPFRTTRPWWQNTSPFAKFYFDVFVAAAVVAS